MPTTYHGHDSWRWTTSPPYDPKTANVEDADRVVRLKHARMSGQACTCNLLIADYLERPERCTEYLGELDRQSLPSGNGYWSVNLKIVPTGANTAQVDQVLPA